MLAFFNYFIALSTLYASSEKEILKDGKNFLSTLSSTVLDQEFFNKLKDGPGNYNKILYWFFKNLIGLEVKVTTTPKPTASSDCMDTDDCPAYGKGACTDYAAWAKTHCKKFCNMCETKAQTSGKVYEKYNHIYY